MILKLSFTVVIISILFLSIKAQEQPFTQLVQFNTTKSDYVAMSGDGSIFMKSLASTLDGGYAYRRYKVTSLILYTIVPLEVIQPPGLNGNSVLNRFIYLNLDGSQFYYADPQSKDLMYFLAGVNGVFSSTPTTTISFSVPIIASSYKNQYLYVIGVNIAKVYSSQSGSLLFIKDMLPTVSVTALKSCATSGNDNLYALSTTSNLYIRQLAPQADGYSIPYPSTGSIFQMIISNDQLTILVGQPQGLFVLTRANTGVRFQLTFSSIVANNLCSALHQLKMINNGEYVFFVCQTPDAVIIAKRQANTSYSIIRSITIAGSVTTLGVQDSANNFIVGTNANFAQTQARDCGNIVSPLCGLVCINPCSTCSLIATNCTGCVSGYVPTPVNGQCTQCSPNCATCSQSPCACHSCFNDRTLRGVRCFTSFQISSLFP